MDRRATRSIGGLAETSRFVPVEAIMSEFRLTAAEARLVKGLCAGLTLAEYARETGLSLSSHSAWRTATGAQFLAWVLPSRLQYLSTPCFGAFARFEPKTSHPETLFAHFRMTIPPT